MIKFFNAIIITVNNNFDIIYDGTLIVKKNKIIYVGDALSDEECSSIINSHACQDIDCKGNIIMPGFINTHAHSAMTLFRGLADGVVFEDWFLKKIQPLEQKLTKEDCYNGTKIAIKEMLSNGITTFFDQYFNYEQTIKAVNELGIRAGIAFGAISGNDIINNESLTAQYNWLLTQKNIYPYIYAHAVYSCDEHQFSTLVSFAKQHKLVFCTHASETLTEVGECHNKYGMTPIGLLESYGVLDLPSVLAHGTHVDKDDIEMLKQYDVTIATNPSANLKLGSGIAPIYSFIKNGINVSIGTDGAAGNNSLDMIKEMYLTGVLQYGIMNNASLISARQLIEMATVNGAKAFKINNLGRLQKGYLADIIMLDVSKPNMQPLNDVLSSVVFSANPSNVIMTMVDGKVVYQK